MPNRIGTGTYFVAFLVAVFFIVLVPIGIALGKDSSWWSAWGQWVGGIGSIAAAVAAVWIALRTWQEADRQAVDLRHKEERQFASQFGVWIDDKRVAHPISGKAEKYYSIKVLNRTSLPVYNVLVYVEFPQSEALRFSYRQPIVGPSDMPIDFELEPYAFHDRLQRAVSILRAVRLNTPLGKLANDLADTNPDLDSWHVINMAKIVVEFTDGNNLRWRRESPGELVRINQAE